MATTNPELTGVFELADKSWNIVKKYWKLFAVVNIFSILGALTAFFPQDTNSNDDFKFFNYNNGEFSGAEFAHILEIGAGIIVIFSLIGSFFYAMTIGLQLAAARKEKLELNDVFEYGTRFWLKVLGLSILTAVLLILGFIALIVPGVILIGRFLFAPYILVDQKLGIIDSLKASNEMARGRAGAVWSVIGIGVLISLATGAMSFIPFIGALIGTVVGIGYSMITVLRYLELKEKLSHSTAEQIVK